MPMRPRSSRMLPVLAVAAVTVAALGAVISSAVSGGDLAMGPVTAQQGPRPAADAPVRVVRRPQAGDVERQRTGCHDCAIGQAPEARL